MSGFNSKLQQGVSILREEGLRDLAKKGFTYAYESSFRAVHSATGKTAQGQNIYERDWDALILLDACRVDLLEEVADEYDFLETRDTFQSLSSYSLGWMNRTFTPEYSDEMKRTAHVTGNPFSQEALDSSTFLTLDEVWRYGWDDDLASIPPRPVTDRAISTAREHNPEKLIVHYMQPHIPFITDTGLSFQNTGPTEWGQTTEDTVWDRVRAGKTPHDEAWAAYRDNLRAVLDDVEILLENIDAETVVISADHGNAVGEHGLYGHPRGIALDCLREIPWVTTTATDSGEYEPTISPSESDDDLNEKLEALGYK